MPWKRNTFYAAARHGNLENIKWLHEKKCPWGKNTFTGAVRFGNLDNMKFLKARGCPWNESTFYEAARVGNLEIMEWLKEKSCPWGEDDASWYSSFPVPIMKWLHENGFHRYKMLNRNHDKDPCYLQ